MQSGDIRTLATWLDPSYVIPCAKEYGIEIAKDLYNVEDLINDNEWLAVLGAQRAYKEIRGMIRSYLSFVKKRDNVKVSELQLALSLRAMGYVGNFQQILPLPQTEWRKTAIEIWSDQRSIPGFIEVVLPDGLKKTDISHAVLKTVSGAMVELPHLNRALLKGRVWQRITGHLLMVVETDRDNIETVLIDPSHLTQVELKTKIFKALRRMKKISNHELRPVAFQLLREWYNKGFIASPAAAIISFAPSIEVGWSALCNNGIPLALSVGMKNNKLTLAAAINHQIWDGSSAGDFYMYMQKNLPRAFEGNW